jgi:hypothetical protein
MKYSERERERDGRGGGGGVGGGESTNFQIWQRRHTRNREANTTSWPTVIHTYVRMA